MSLPQNEKITCGDVSISVSCPPPDPLFITDWLSEQSLVDVRMQHTKHPRHSQSKIHSDYSEFPISSTQISALDAKNWQLRDIYHKIYCDARICSHLIQRLNGGIFAGDVYTVFVEPHRTYAYIECEFEIDIQTPQRKRLSKWLAGERYRLLK
jgi:hypothetical protein